jgi:hypothetical protein
MSSTDSFLYGGVCNDTTDSLPRRGAVPFTVAGVQLPLCNYCCDSQIDLQAKRSKSALICQNLSQLIDRYRLDRIVDD